MLRLAFTCRDASPLTDRNCQSLTSNNSVRALLHRHEQAACPQGLYKLYFPHAILFSSYNLSTAFRGLVHIFIQNSHTFHHSKASLPSVL
jgi:hypothetical protein